MITPSYVQSIAINLFQAYKVNHEMSGAMQEMRANVTEETLAAAIQVLNQYPQEVHIREVATLLRALQDCYQV